MGAAVLTALNTDLEVRDDLQRADRRPGELRIEVGAGGGCHSDVSFQNGTLR